jgi:hypothetical protein
VAVQSAISYYVAVAASTTGGTAPGGATAPTGCSLSSASDISSWVTQVEAGADVATNDVTTFGSGGFTNMVAGLKTGTANIGLLMDYAASATNALLGLGGSVIAFGAQGFLEVKPSSGSRSATNPSFICKIINNGWRPFNATVGGIPVVTWNVTVIGGFAELTS